jgi:prepilin-type N-terminal cleavage/methylation domain-containing protein
MKRAFTLIETVISVAILSVVMLILLQIKENNIYFLQKVEDSTKIDMQLALGMGLSDFNNTLEEKKFYIKDLLTLKDDEVRQKIKEIQVTRTIEEPDELEVGSEDFPISVLIYKENYSLKDGSNKNMYSFTLE